MATERTNIRKSLNQAMRILEEVEREVVVYTRPTDLDLVGTNEAAEILGVKPNLISDRRRRGRFPEPIVVLSCGPIWHRADIEAIAE